MTGLVLGSGTLLRHQQLCSEVERSLSPPGSSGPAAPTACSSLRADLCCAALLKLAHLSHLERRAKFLWGSSSTAGPSSCFQKHRRLPPLAGLRRAAPVQGNAISDVTPHIYRWGLLKSLPVFHEAAFAPIRFSSILSGCE